MESIQLKRACDAIQIPAGNTVELPPGTEVYITQTLGGSFTVRVEGGLFRIADKDADALGMEPGVASSQPAINPEDFEEGHVWEALKTCFDPEIPVNIVDLGLIYDMVVTKNEAGDNKVDVKMTLTAPGCGMGPTIAADAQDKIVAIPGVGEAVVEIVWDPPWHQSMITAAGKEVLGIE